MTLRKNGIDQCSFESIARIEPWLVLVRSGDTEAAYIVVWVDRLVLEADLQECAGRYIQGRWQCENGSVVLAFVHVAVDGPACLWILIEHVGNGMCRLLVISNR